MDFCFDLQRAFLDLGFPSIQWKVTLPGAKFNDEGENEIKLAIVIGKFLYLLVCLDIHQYCTLQSKQLESVFSIEFRRQILIL